MHTNRTTFRVIYGDTDKMGIAYHANYFRWFESARTEMFRAWGLPYKNIEAQGYFLPVTEVYCRFLSPVEYDDLLSVETTIDRTAKASLQFNYAMFDEDQKKIAEGYTKHACINREGKAVRPPRFLRDVIDEDLET